MSSNKSEEEDLFDTSEKSVLFICLLYICDENLHFETRAGASLGIPHAPCPMPISFGLSSCKSSAHASSVLRRLHPDPAAIDSHSREILLRKNDYLSVCVFSSSFSSFNPCVNTYHSHILTCCLQARFMNSFCSSGCVKLRELERKRA